MTRPSWIIFVAAAVLLLLAVIGLFMSGTIGIQVDLPPAPR